MKRIRDTTLIPPSITKAQAFKERGCLVHMDYLHSSVSDFGCVYAGCGFADLAKFAMAHMAFSLSAFTQPPSSGKTANQWRDANSSAEGILANMIRTSVVIPEPSILQSLIAKLSCSHHLQTTTRHRYSENGLNLPANQIRL